MPFVAGGLSLQLTADERKELKCLPVAIQIIAKKTLQGSTTDLARLVDLISVPRSSHLFCLVPIFHATLKSVQVPDYINPKTIPTIIRAKWALMGVLKISTITSSVTHHLVDNVGMYIVRKWDEIYPWMRFFARNCLPPPYDVSVTPPRPDICNMFDAVTLCITPLSLICTISEEGRHLLRSSVSVQHFVAQLWTLVGNLRGDVLQGDPGNTPNSLVSNICASFALTNFVCVSESEDPDKITLPVSNYIHAAGGVKPVVITLLKYIRRITRDATAVEEPQPSLSSTSWPLG
ncbi:hypothetical protein BDR07DRAFT_1391730 [Suillus spraguei]|nr:hypothetical protein BDR07DRAFT_1391730 [Suillus spraguei]